MIPVERACLASIENFEKFMPELIEQSFPPAESRTWCLLYKCRSNSKFYKEQFLQFLREKIPQSYKYIDYNADLHILIDITQHIMCLSVLSNFQAFRKFSFQKKVDKEAPPKESQSKEQALQEAPLEQKVEIHLEDIGLV